MNLKKSIAAAVLLFSLSTAPAVFADARVSVIEKNVAAIVTVKDTKDTRQDTKDFRHKHDEFSKDPVKMLEEKKIKVQELLKEGKITKEKADEINSRLNSKIKEIQSFNKLTLEQKREKLISDCKAKVEKLIKEGKLDSTKGNEIISRYTEKINSWDGTGYPFYHPGKSGHGCRECKPEK